jgi:hypothetical protein
MISCETFRAQFAPSTEDAAVLEHLRSCDACLDSAAMIDPDVMFRALGGSELVPPGGVDAFVGDVMREVRLRTTEHRMTVAPDMSWRRRLAVAAVLTAGLSGTLFIYQQDRARVAPVVVPAVLQAVAAPLILTNKPVVEQYDSDRATIVEMPTDGVADVAVVMVFDENLPADL